MMKHISLLSLALGLFVFGQANQEVRPLEPGQPVERELAGGQTHTYQIKLTAGQVFRVGVEQKGIDVALTLAGPDGKQLIESDRASMIGARAPLPLEATAARTHQLVIA